VSKIKLEKVQEPQMEPESDAHWMFNLKLKKNRNFIDMIGLIIHQ
jgi:hypothetical protein